MSAAIPYLQLLALAWLIICTGACLALGLILFLDRFGDEPENPDGNLCLGCHDVLVAHCHSPRPAAMTCALCAKEWRWEL